MKLHETDSKKVGFGSVFVVRFEYFCVKKNIKDYVCAWFIDKSYLCYKKTVRMIRLDF